MTGRSLARWCLIAWGAAVIVGCTNNVRPQQAQVRLVLNEQSTEEQFDQCVGKAVSLEGIAEDRKAGAFVRLGSSGAYLDGWREWPKDLLDKNVRVVGVLRVEIREPAHVDKNGIPTYGGMFGKIYFLEDARVDSSAK